MKKFKCANEVIKLLFEMSSAFNFLFVIIRCVMVIINPSFGFKEFTCSLEGLLLFPMGAMRRIKSAAGTSCVT